MSAFLPTSYSATAAIVLLAGYVALNFKALPLVHSISLLPPIFRLLRPRMSPPGPTATKDDKAPLKDARALFAPYTSASRAVFGDLDINVHKSNSTFFADADISRAELLTRLFARACVDVTSSSSPSHSSSSQDSKEDKAPRGKRKAKAAIPLLAGVQARFLREIRPFQAYAVISRVLAWDESSLHVVTYFVRPGWKLEKLESAAAAAADKKGGIVVGPTAILADDKARKGVFAILVSRYVIRAGRDKIAPVDLFRAAGVDVGKDGEYAGVMEKANAEGTEYMKGCLF